MMLSSTAVCADSIHTSTTHLALDDIEFRLKGNDIKMKKGEPGCRISFNQMGTLYYGVIVDCVNGQVFTVAPPDDVWAPISGDSVNRGWDDYDGLCTVRKETIVAVIDDSNMMQIRFHDPVTDDITDDDMDIEAPNDETTAPNEAESSSSSYGVHVQSTAQPNSASTPPHATMLERRKSNRKSKKNKFFDDDDYHKDS
jgi:hypothetical protein|tara:strand:- start:272 stop:865 length:594 start_codon:yes stop_codon:yes gene_type:complete